MPAYQTISFQQYESGTNDDQLILFSAPAKAIASWAGIPRKGWNIRMLYQRWITQSREQELVNFWNVASTRDEHDEYILGPTALTIAIRDSAPITEGNIELEYESPLDVNKTSLENLKSLSELVIPKIRGRLSPQQAEIFDQFNLNPLVELPDTEHDYVLESVMQFSQMARDPQWFKEKNSLVDSAIEDIVVSLEALCRPALVVDGQHRLFGAAQSDNEIWLPVVAIPNCNWAEQIYQFVVINEKAQRVETSLLTDIFGSSLTREEQSSLREKLERSKVQVEERIAAVIASRDQNSPFFNMVRLNLAGAPPDGAKPYIPELTIRTLIEGGRSTLGWRTSDDFFDNFIAPTFPSRPEWDSWTTGRWREYWFEFWRTVAEFYNRQAQIETGDPQFLLWNPTEIHNLTKSVTMRLFQRLFIEQAVERVKQVRQSRDLLIDVVGTMRADEEIANRVKTYAIPESLNEFSTSIREWFLEKGVPVRFFLKPWRGSLDDAQGQTDLWDEMEKAFDYSQEGKRYHTRNVNVFATDDQ